MNSYKCLKQKSLKTTINYENVIKAKKHHLKTQINFGTATNKIDKCKAIGGYPSHIYLLIGYFW
jgi:hypothetical protein